MTTKGKIILPTSLAIFTLAASFMGSFAWFVNTVTLSETKINGSSEAAYFAYGDGSENNPFGISVPRHLRNLAWLQYMGEFSDSHYYFELASNIDAGNYVIPPIGTEDNPFIGVFDGQGYTISNLKVTNDGTAFTAKPSNVTYNQADAEVVGFFGVVGTLEDESYSSSVNCLKDVTLNNITVESKTDYTLIGLAAGYINAAMSGVKVGSSNIITNGNSAKPYTANLSDYGLVGYTTKTGANGTFSQKLSNYYNSSSSGDDAGWGGSIDMKAFYNRLDTLKGNYGKSQSLGYVFDDVYDTDDNRLSHTVRNNKSYTYQAVYDEDYTKNGVTYNSKIGALKARYSDGNTSGTGIYYLGAGHYTVSTTKIFHVHDGFRINSGTDYSLTVTSFRNNQGVSNAAQNASVVWHEKSASGGVRLYTTYGNNTSTSTPYYLQINNTTNLRIVTSENNGTVFTKQENPYKPNTYWYTSGNYYIGYNSGWKMITIPSAPTAPAQPRPTEPVVQPTEPTLPLPTEPVAPTAPSAPTEPSAPTAPVLPLPTEPTLPLPTEPTTPRPTEPVAEPTAPTEPTEPVAPTNPAAPTAPTGPIAPVAYGKQIYFTDTNGKKHFLIPDGTTSVKASETPYNGNWTWDNSNKKISVAIDGTPYYLKGSRSGNRWTGYSYTLSLDNLSSNATIWTKNNSTFSYTFTGSGVFQKDTTAYIRFDDTTFVLSETNTQASLTVDEIWTVYFGSPMLKSEADNQYDLDDAKKTLMDGQYNAALEEYNASHEQSQNEPAGFDTDYARYQTDLAAYNTAWAQYQTNMTNYNTALTQYQNGSGTYTAAYNAYITAITSYNTAYAAYQTALTSYNTVNAEYPGAVTAYNNAYAQYLIDLAAYNAYDALMEQWGQYDSDLADYNAAWAQYNSDLAAYNAEQAQYASDLVIYNNAYALYEDALDEYNANHGQNQNATTDYDTDYAQYLTDLAAYNSAWTQYQTNLTSYSTAYSQYQADSGTYNYNTTYTPYQTAITSYNTAYSAYQTALTSYNTAYASYQTALAEYNAAWAQYNSDLAAYNAYIALLAEWSNYDTLLEQYNAKYLTLPATRVEGPDYYTTSRSSGMDYSNDQDVTYLPLAVENNLEAKITNTGYIMGGETIASASSSHSGSGNVRVCSWYTLAEDLTNYNEDDEQFDKNSIYTYDASGLHTIDDDKEANPATKTYAKYIESKGKIESTLATGSNIYGLHFTNAEINKNNVVTARYAAINGETFSNYQMPANAIDFNLRDQGYINFFAGTYGRYSVNNSTVYTCDSFFSLHQIQRSGSIITNINEIQEIYSDGVSGHAYIYKYTNGSCTIPYSIDPYNSKKLYVLGTKYLITDTAHGGYSDGIYHTISASDMETNYPDYKKVFDMSWLKDHTYDNDEAYNQEAWHKAFYFEIPTNPGEYALGTVAGKNYGAYLMYLDIGANAANRDKITAYGVSTFKSGLSYPLGVDFDTTDASNKNGGQTLGIIIATGSSGEVSFVVDATNDTIAYESDYSTTYAYNVQSVTGESPPGAAEVPPATGTRAIYTHIVSTDNTVWDIVTTETLDENGTSTSTPTFISIKHEDTVLTVDDLPESFAINSIRGSINTIIATFERLSGTNEFNVSALYSGNDFNTVAATLDATGITIRIKDIATGYTITVNGTSITNDPQVYPSA